MRTIFCLYETVERFPRFVRAAVDAATAYDDILAGALDGLDDDVSVWIAAQIRAGLEIARYDLQVEVEAKDVQFFVEYWESQFAEIVRQEPQSAGDEATRAGQRVLTAINEKEGQS